MKALSPNDRPREKLLRARRGGPRRQRADRHRRRQRLAATAMRWRSPTRFSKTPAACTAFPEPASTICGVSTAWATRQSGAGAGGRRAGPPHAAAMPAGADAVRHPRDVAAYLLPQFGSQPVEQFGLVMLDTKHRLLRTSVISVGTLDSSPAHPREIFREAASACAAAHRAVSQPSVRRSHAKPRRCGC